MRWLVVLLPWAPAVALWGAGSMVTLSPPVARGLLLAALMSALVAVASAARLRRRAPAGAGAALLSGVLGFAAAAAWIVLLLRVPPATSFPSTTEPETRSGPADGAPERLRVLQLNVLHGYPEFDRQEERVTALLDALRRLRPDIAVLQEVWKTRAHGDLARRLASELGMDAVYAGANGSLALLGFEEGSAILSRFPIVGARRLLLAPRKTVFQRHIALVAEIELDRGERVAVAGAHLANAAPEVAAAQAADLARQLAGGGLPLLIAGDLNVASDSLAVRRLVEEGYVDLLAGPLDHVLVARDGGWHALWSERVLAPHEQPRPLSDHPGILVELQASRPPRQGRWRGEWVLARAEDRGFDPVRIERAVEQIGSLDGVQGLLVARDGALVVERYFRGGGRDRLHNLKSASKSVLSAVVGVAIADGYLDLDQPIGEILDVEALDGGAARDPRKSGITVRDLLTMRSGLESVSFDQYGAWVSSRNWVASALRRSLEAAPGTRFRYSTGDTHLLSAVVTAATGRSTLDFAQERLFGPLGIRSLRWQRDPQGIHFGGNNLAMTPRDLARFGLLYLDRGRWGDRQLVPWQWVDASTRRQVGRSSRRFGGYGYLWWLRPPGERGAYLASGYGGQYLYVSQAFDTAVVVTSSESSKGRTWRSRLFEVIRQDILGPLDPLDDWPNGRRDPHSTAG